MCNFDHIMSDCHDWTTTGRTDEGTQFDDDNGHDGRTEDDDNWTDDGTDVCIHNKKRTYIYVYTYIHIIIL